jgi:tripartite-type tricarboxylate transporter receptor subunit TctC
MNCLKISAFYSIFAFATAAVFSSGAVAQSVDFRGKRIDVIMGSAAGGGTDTTTRLVGRFLTKYLPGNPEMNYRNMPGGHGTKALNHFAESVKPDGLTWIGGSSSHIDPNTLLKPAIHYDPTKFNYIGGASRGGSIIFIRKDKLKNLFDRSLPPVIVGELDGNRSWAQMVMWGADALDWNIKFVIGYPGTSFLLLAIRRGEIDMMGTSNLTLLRDMFKTGNFVGVAQMGDTSETDGSVTGRSTFPDIPVMEVLVDGKLAGVQKETFDFWVGLNAQDKWYALPPGTPQAVIDTYRTAYNKMVKDPEFLKLARNVSEDFEPMSGPTIQRIVARTSYPQKYITDYIEGMKRKHGLPAEGLSDEELAKLAKEKGLDKMPSIEAVLKQVGSGGRDIVFAIADKDVTADVSSSRTDVMIAGQKVERGALKAGMVCEISHPGGEKQSATAVHCK